MMLFDQTLGDIRDTFRGDHNSRLLPAIVDPLHTLLQHILLCLRELNQFLRKQPSQFPLQGFS